MEFSKTKGDHNTLYVFAASEEDPLYQLQMESLAGRKTVSSEHDIIITEIIEHGQSHSDAELFTADQCRELEQQYHILPGHFKVVLVGRDSAVKLCTDSCISFEEILMRIENDPADTMYRS